MAAVGGGVQAVEAPARGGVAERVGRVVALLAGVEHAVAAARETEARVAARGVGLPPVQTLAVDAVAVLGALALLAPLKRDPGVSAKRLGQADVLLRGRVERRSPFALARVQVAIGVVATVALLGRPVDHPVATGRPARDAAVVRVPHAVRVLAGRTAVVGIGQGVVGLTVCAFALAVAAAGGASVPRTVIALLSAIYAVQHGIAALGRIVAGLARRVVPLAAVARFGVAATAGSVTLLRRTVYDSIRAAVGDLFGVASNHRGPARYSSHCHGIWWILGRTKVVRDGYWFKRRGKPSKHSTDVGPVIGAQVPKQTVPPYQPIIVPPHSGARGV